MDFLGLQNTYLEKDLEEAILRELEAFILELGKGTAFLSRPVVIGDGIGSHAIKICPDVFCLPDFADVEIDFKK